MLRLSSLQRTIVAIGLLSVAASGLYVPWQVRIADNSGNAAVIDRGFALLHALPEGYVEVDYRQILLRWAVIAAFTGASFLLAGLLPLPTSRKKT